MKASPSSTEHKDHRRLPVKRQLKREIEIAWNREIPGSVAEAIPWLVLQSVVDNLSGKLDPNAVMRLQTVIKNRDVEGYLSLGAEFGPPQLHGDHASYFTSSSVLNLFKKFPFTESNLDPQAKAKSRSVEAEMLCTKTNRRLSRHRLSDFASKPLTKRLDVHGIYHSARRKISNWIGEELPVDLFASVGFGPGGCVGTSRPYTTPFYKLGVSEYTVTSGAYWYAMRVILQNDSWLRSLLIDQHGSAIDDTFNESLGEESFRKFSLSDRLKAVDSRIQIADYNKVTYVPKDASTHRAIAVEPHLNVMLQLSVGGFFKEKLRAAGCDLKDQSRNQQLAEVASLYDCDHVSTIDLRMASDCLAIELVRELLPCKWFELLDNLRSREGRIDGKTTTWNKFSSMGNGFTFELESMIFYALAQSVSDLEGTSNWYADTFGPAYRYAEVSVFGDDIIVPNSVVDKLIAILRFSGFLTNTEKSFTSGPFRESCGKDYYEGVLVRPFYMKRALSQIKDLVHLRNNVRGMVFNGLYELGETLLLIDTLLPPVLTRHLVGPRRTTGDEYIWREPDACHHSSAVVWDTDYQAWSFPVMRCSSVCAPQGRHMLHWVYTQFLYANTDRYLKLDQLNNSPGRDYFLDHLMAGGSAVDVVLSGQTSEGVITFATI